MPKPYIVQEKKISIRGDIDVTKSFNISFRLKKKTLKSMKLILFDMTNIFLYILSLFR